MTEDLQTRISKLPLKERNNFNKRLISILNDRYSSFIYGLNEKDYVTLPKEKLERVKEILYNEIFRNIIPPRTLTRDFSYNLS